MTGRGPGPVWQQCYDQTSGYPYYWNTATNQVRWDCPPELRQEWQPPLPPSLPPPSLLTQVSLASPAPTVAADSDGAEKAGPAPQSSLVTSYDSDSGSEGRPEGGADSGPPASVEKAGVETEKEDQPKFIGAGILYKTSVSTTDFIGPVIPKTPEDPTAEISSPVLNNQDDRKAEVDGSLQRPDPPPAPDSPLAGQDSTDDILSAIEAEKPPDYKSASPAPRQQQPAPAPLPAAKPVRRQLQPSSMLQLACNYGHESDSEAEEEPQSAARHRPAVTGELDRAGRLVFSSAEERTGSEEQRLALESVKRELGRASQQQTGLARAGLGGRNKTEEVITVATGRKRRLDLPRGRFNKEDHRDRASPGPASEQQLQAETVPPARLSSTEQQKGATDEVCVNSCKDNGNGPNVVPEDVSLTTAELVEKLEYFKVGEEKTSPLKTLAIKLETLYSAWAAGALSLPYYNVMLGLARRRLGEAEAGLARPPWVAHWHR